MNDDSHVRLQEYLERWFEAKLESVWKVLEERQKYLDKTEQALIDRLHSMNEVREQLNRQSTTFLTRERFEAEHRIIMIQIDELRTWKSEQLGKQSRSNIIAVAAVIVSIIALILKFVV